VDAAIDAGASGAAAVGKRGGKPNGNEHHGAGQTMMTHTKAVPESPGRHRKRSSSGTKRSSSGTKQAVQVQSTPPTASIDAGMSAGMSAAARTGTYGSKPSGNEQFRGGQARATQKKAQPGSSQQSRNGSSSTKKLLEDDVRSSSKTKQHANTSSKHCHTVQFAKYIDHFPAHFSPSSKFKQPGYSCTIFGASNIVVLGMNGSGKTGLIRSLVLSSQSWRSDQTLLFLTNIDMDLPGIMQPQGGSSKSLANVLGVVQEPCNFKARQEVEQLWEEIVPKKKLCLQKIGTLNVSFLDDKSTTTRIVEIFQNPGSGEAVNFPKDEPQVLSSGELRLLYLLCALCTRGSNVSHVLLDEPNTHMNSSLAFRFFDVIQEKLSLSLTVVTHDLELAKHLSAPQGRRCGNINEFTVLLLLSSMSGEKVCPARLIHSIPLHLLIITMNARFAAKLTSHNVCRAFGPRSGEFTQWTPPLQMTFGLPWTYFATHAKHC